MKPWPTELLLEVTTIASNRVEPFQGKRFYVATGGLDGGVLATLEEVDFESKPSRADVVARQGDVLFARMQATNKVAVVTKETENHIWSTGFAALRPKPCLHSRYLMHYLASPFFQKIKDTYCTGSTQKALPNQGLKKLHIPVPPLAEQERIVKLLDEADELRNLRAHADHRTAVLIPALFHEMFGKQHLSRGSWPTRQLREISGIIVPTRDKPKQFVGTVPWVTLPDLTGLFIDSSKNLLTHEDARVVANRLMPANTVLLSCAGTLGKVAVALVQLYANQQFYGLTPNPAIVDSIFLAVCLQLKGEKFFARLAGTSTLGFFSKQKALEIEIVVPPLLLQKEFAQRVIEIHELESAQSSSRQRLDDLFQSMLHRAFNGDL